MRFDPRFAVAAILVGVLAVSISACGGGGDTGSSGTTSTGSSDRGDVSGTIKVWDTEYKVLPLYTKAIDQLDAEFEELHPGVKVVREAQPLAGMSALLHSAFTAHEGPDAVLMQTGEGLFSYSQGMEVLNDQLDPALQDELTGWGSVTPGFTEEGDHYGVPFGLIGFDFYYNKELFKQAGLPTDFEPQTWDEVREAGEALKQAGIQPFVGGNKEGSQGLLWMTQGYETVATPEQYTELAEGTLDYTDEGMTNAFGPMFEMAEAGLLDLPTMASTEIAQGCGEFADGKGAMTIGFWNAFCYWGEFEAALGKGNLGYFLAPGTKDPGTNAAYAMAVPDFAENKDGALALIEFEASKKGTETLVDVGGFFPNRDDVSLPASMPAMGEEMVEIARESVSKTSPLIMVPAAVYEGPMTTEINQALQGRTTLEAALEAMQEVAEKEAR